MGVQSQTDRQKQFYFTMKAFVAFLSCLAVAAAKPGYVAQAPVAYNYGYNGLVNTAYAGYAAPAIAHTGVYAAPAAAIAVNPYAYANAYPAAEPYIHQEILAEPYLHEEIPAEPYIHEEIPAEAYKHEEIPAEAYKHEEIPAEPYIHQEVLAEPYIPQEPITVAAPVAVAPAAVATYAAAPVAAATYTAAPVATHTYGYTT